MILQVGPAKLQISIDEGETFYDAFVTTNSTITIAFAHRDRVNDGVIVESVFESANVSFEVNASEWSLEILRYLFPLSYTYSDANIEDHPIITGDRRTRSHQLDLVGLVEVGSHPDYTQYFVWKTVPACWLRFIPNISSKAATVNIFKARISDDLVIPFDSSQGNITFKGTALKHPDHSFITITFDECISI